jgi:hypothetical protein
LVHFGLQDLNNGLYSPTELSKRILEGQDSDVALREACFRPALFREILFLYKPVRRVPIQLALALSFDHGIQGAARDEVASIFMASTVYAGILDADGTFRGEPGVEIQGAASPSGNEPAPKEDDQIVHIYLTDQKKAKIYVPARLNEQDIALLRAQIDVLELQVRVNRPDQPVRLDLFRDNRRR